MSALNEVLLKELKKPGNSKKHYNLVSHVEYPKVSSGSLLFDHKTGGGFEPGVVCAYGHTEGGKTSFFLQCVAEFLKEPNRKALFLKSEGRLSKDIMDRSEINFVFDVEQWVSGSCFVLKSNDYDLFLSFLEKIIFSGDDCKFAIVVDSLNGLRSDNERMCGTAAITSNLLQEYNIHIIERGHYCFFTSQKRAQLKEKYESREMANPFEMSGGFAIQHYPNWVLQFSNASLKSNQIKKGEAVVGHNCLITLRKTTNETTGDRIDFPIKHGVKKGSSVWLERELFAFFKMFDLIVKEGKSSLVWSGYAKGFNDKLEMSVPEKFRGEDAFIDYLENNSEFCQLWKKELQEHFINDQEI